MVEHYPANTVLTNYLISTSVDEVIATVFANVCMNYWISTFVDSVLTSVIPFGFNKLLNFYLCRFGTTFLSVIFEWIIEFLLM